MVAGHRTQRKREHRCEVAEISRDFGGRHEVRRVAADLRQCVCNHDELGHERRGEQRHRQGHSDAPDRVYGDAERQVSLGDPGGNLGYLEQADALEREHEPRGTSLQSQIAPQASR